MLNGARLALAEISADPFTLDGVTIDPGGRSAEYAAAAQRLLGGERSFIFPAASPCPASRCCRCSRSKMSGVLRTARVSRAAGTSATQGWLKRLGLLVTCLPATCSAQGELDVADILFIDTDSRDSAPLGATLITIIGYERPSRLRRAYELEPAAFLVKPARPNGVFAALYFAVIGSRRRPEMREQPEQPEGATGYPAIRSGATRRAPWGGIRGVGRATERQHFG